MPTNSSSTTAKRYREDVPNMIQEKIDLLCDQERHIAMLEAQLNELRSRRERLENELGPYRIHTHSAPAQAVAATLTQDTRYPIHCLPNELLHLIFELVVHGGFGFGRDSHRVNLGKVLQICRRWYDLIMHSPSLWARIEIPEAMFFIGIRGQNPPIQYIEACLLHSQSLPLDIELEFEELNASNYIQAELYAYAETLVDEDEYGSIADQIYGQQVHSSIFLAKLHRFLNSLFGENGQHLRRWRALTISLPQEEELANLVWLRMAPTMGYLTSIEIFGAPSSWSNGRVLADADLSNINSLRIRGLDTQDNFTVHLPNVFLTTLTSLDIGVGASVTNLQGLSSLQHLRSLKLSCSGLPFQMNENGAAPLFSLHLPRLNKLTLEGNYIHLSQISFKLPALQILSILVESPLQRLPALSPSSIEWRLGWCVQKYVETDVAVLVSLIRDVLLLSKTTRRITIPEVAKAEFLEQIRQCRSERAKVSLSEIVMEAHDRVPEIIDVVNLV